MAAPKKNKFALGNNGGRPSKYDPKYCDQIVKFFKAVPSDEELAYRKENKQIINFPTFEAFAVSIDVVMSTLLEWCKAHEEFSISYEKCKYLQKDFLNKAGLNELFNAGYSKFMAINCTDMRDKIEQDLNANIKTRIVIEVDDSQIRI
jgi:hypothetical protein